MEDEAVGTTIKAPEEDEQEEIPEEDPMVLLRESNQHLSEEVAQLKAQIEEVATERSRKRELKHEAKASFLQAKREQQHADQGVQTEALEVVPQLTQPMVSQVVQTEAREEVSQVVQTEDFFQIHNQTQSLL